VNWYVFEFMDNSEGEVDKNGHLKINSKSKVNYFNTSSQNFVLKAAYAQNTTPYVFFENNDVLIVGDIVIYNILNHGVYENVDWTEQELLTNLISLYNTFGLDFVKRLDGEFSFVLFDKKNLTLMACRDTLGVKRLFYLKTDTKLVVASDIFLLKSYLNTPELNGVYFQEYLNAKGIVDSYLTPYKEILRLPSGNMFVYENKEINLINYVNYDELFSDKWMMKETTINREALIEEFESILNKAVLRRVRKSERNTVLLSGGLDSTTIFNVSKRLGHRYGEINSVSVVFDELKECDESAYITELLEQYNSKGTFLNYDSVLMYEDLRNNILRFDEPYATAPTCEFISPLIESSVNNNTYSILTGYGGDQLLTNPPYLLRDYVREGKIKDMFGDLTKYCMYTNMSAFKGLREYIIQPHPFSRTTKNKRNHARNLLHQMLNAKANHYMDRAIGGFYGADIKHPFLDRELISFMIKIPSHILFDPFYTKKILRDSQKNKLPDSIRLRINKTSHIAHTLKSIRKNWNSIYSNVKSPLVVSKLGLCSEEFWEENLYKWRNGLLIDEAFLLLFSIEVWIMQEV